MFKKLDEINYVELVEEALTGDTANLNDCANLFHSYSLLNTMRIANQERRRGLRVQPVKGYKAWEKLGRKVKDEYTWLNKKTKQRVLYKEHGIEVMFPYTKAYPMKDPVTKEPLLNKDGKPRVKTITIGYDFKSYHVPYDYTEQIEGMEDKFKQDEKDIVFDVEKVCKYLKIKLSSYDTVDAQSEGYSRPSEQMIAINPFCKYPTHCAVHEIAHCLLHKDVKLGIADKIFNTPIVSQIECEAEMTAYLVCSILNADEMILKSSRGYIQGWFRDGVKLTNETSRKVISASNRILQAIYNKKGGNDE